MCLVRLAILGVSAILPAWNQTVTIVQPEAAGIELIGSQSPAFQPAIQSIVSPEAPPQLGAWLPFTVILRNNSSQALVGYLVRWSIDGTGAGSGMGMVAGPNPWAYLQPGASVIVQPHAFVTDASGIDQLVKSMGQIEGTLAALRRGKAIGVFLDYVILASGRFIGPDIESNFAQAAAAFTAWRPVNTEVQSEFASGESLDVIAANLSRMAAPQTWTSRESFDPNAPGRIS